MNKEQKFFNAIRDVFVGAKVEGESGYINLMRIKSRYFTEGVFPQLQKDINAALKPFPTFRDEFFEKLYDFFHRYFSESGSIYFCYTPLHQNVYEKVYTDDKDVMLFWKTHMLYYVKTDRLFVSLEVDLGSQKFFFDVSTLEHKKANEKRDIVYTFKEKRKDGALAFTATYSERGRQTKMDEILRAVRLNGDTVKEDTLQRAFRVFEKQSEVDYFINKDAKAFLEEQFNLWLYQYAFSGASEWTEARIKQLQTLRGIAFKIIAFISQFESELVKIWNKPKFVLKSNYVITLGRIADKHGGLAVVKKLLAHKHFKAHIEEWRKLGIVGKSFKKSEVMENNGVGKGGQLAEAWQHLPVDTKYFEDLKFEILGLFEHLDESLDGWLIKSENYQALNTILQKFRGSVQTIYIDPPFNTGDDFDYVDRYQTSTWLTVMSERLALGRKFLNNTGGLFLHLDFNADFLGRLLLDDLFGKGNFSNEIKWYYTNKIPDTRKKSFTNSFDVILAYAMSYESKVFTWLFDKRDKPIKVSKMRKEDGKKIYVKDESGKGIYQIRTERTMDNVWQIPLLHAQPEIVDFKTQKPEELLRRVIACSTETKDRSIVLDYFVGSATSIVVAHKLRKKWIGIEMGSHFEGKALPRIKEAFAGNSDHEPCGISEQVKWCGGGFCKYYYLEQYEDALRRVKYADGDLFDDPNKDAYHQYVFLRDQKMLEVLEVDTKKNTAKVDLGKLFDGIDVPETLSNLTGKWIKRITANSVEFEDGEVLDTRNLDWKRIKPLIWW